MRMVLVLGMVCAGCVAEPPASGRSAALYDAYLVAKGMATSYGERPDADPAVVQRLDQMDERAASALRDRDSEAVAAAVAAMASVAGREGF